MNTSSRRYTIEVDALSFSYPDGIAALSEVTVRAAPAEFVAIVGANGSGKTTLLKSMLRLIRPTAGRVLLGGRDIRELAPAELYGQVGMVFQNPSDQLFAPTVEEDVAFGPRNLGLSDDEVEKRVAESLEAVDAVALRRRPIHHLSFGEQKRICLAGVLAMQPAVLVLDEPTAGLDPACEAHMVELLLRLGRSRRITMVLATHAVDLLPVLAHRVYVLNKGRVLREGEPAEIFADADAAAEAGLRLPLVSQLFRELAGRDGLSFGRLPLTVEEGRRQVLAWLESSVPAKESA